MKPGKVGRALAVCTLSGVVCVQAVMLTELPKLEDRVDELTVQNESLEEDYGKVQSAMEELETAYELLDAQKEQLETELEAKAVLVDALEQANAALTNEKTKLVGEKKKLEGEVSQLKKTKAVRAKKATTVAGFEEGQVVGSNFEVTWYNDTGLTATGARTKDGITVAVDPRLIPYGSKLKITMPDGTVLYRTAQDTGSAVKKRNGGRVVDIYASVSTEELYQRGRTTGVKVEIL